MISLGIFSIGIARAVPMGHLHRVVGGGAQLLMSKKSLASVSFQYSRYAAQVLVLITYDDLVIQGYLARKKTHPPRTLPQAYA